MKFDHTNYDIEQFAYDLKAVTISRMEMKTSEAETIIMSDE